jgi:hypothetical protein
MEFRRISNVLMSTPMATAPLRSIMANSTSSAIRLQRPRTQSIIARTSQARAYTISSPLYAARPTVTTSANPSPNSQTQRPPTTTSPASTAPGSDISSRQAWTTPQNAVPFRLKSELEKKVGSGKSSSLELLEHIQAFGTSPRNPTAQSSVFDVSMMALPSSPLDIEGVQNDVSTTVSAVPRNPLRLGPRIGRTVHVNDKTDVTSAIRKMETLVAKNHVRRHFQIQRFHERGGLKRKRLRRERWRKKFKDGFKAVVDRVQHLRKQGW